MREDFHFPLPGRARIAFIEADFHGKRLRLSDELALRRYAPDSLALPLNCALALANRKLRLPSLRRAIVIFTEELMRESDRDLLWKTFGLPIFEQLRAKNGQVIARECEAHNGLHIDPPFAAGFEQIAEIDRNVCECGAETPRLLRLRVCESRAAAA